MCLLPLKRVRNVIMKLVVEGIVAQHEINLTKAVYAYSVKIAAYLPLLRERILKVTEIDTRAN